MCENSSSRACSNVVGVVSFRGSLRFLAMRAVLLSGGWAFGATAPQDNGLCGIMPRRGSGFPKRPLEVQMSDEVYGPDRAQRLVALLRALAERIQELDRAGGRRLLDAAPELQKLLGNARSELFHYEVRSTYDTPEVAESRRIVDEAIGGGDFAIDDPDDDEPWRPLGGGDQ